MAHKIIAFLAAFTCFITAISSEKLSETEKKFALITDALSECARLIQSIEKNVDQNKNNFDTVNKKITDFDDNQKNLTQTINDLTSAIKFAQNDIRALQKYNTNNDLHVDTLEDSVNLIGERIQTVSNEVQTLDNKITKNYVSKGDLKGAQEELNTLTNFVKNLKDEFNFQDTHKTPSSILCKKYLLKITPAAVIIGCIAVLYFIKKPLKKSIAYCQKKLKNICTQKLWGIKDKEQKIVL